jgi:hypothetical protein
MQNKNKNAALDGDGMMEKGRMDASEEEGYLAAFA